MTDLNQYNSNTVSCDGTDANMGHPKVYLNHCQDYPAICPYCGQKF